MKQLVRGCSLFILFASRKSLKSTWCQFEIALAEVEVIKRNIRIYVFPLESGIEINEIPEWMRSYWLNLDFDNEKTRTRRLSKLLSSEFIPPILQGAIERIEDANRLRLSHMQQHQIWPQCSFFFLAPHRLAVEPLFGDSLPKFSEMEDTITGQKYTWMTLHRLMIFISASGMNLPDFGMTNIKERAGLVQVPGGDSKVGHIVDFCELPTKITRLFF